MSGGGASGPRVRTREEGRASVPLGEYGLDATDLADAVHLAAVMKQAADGTSRLRYGHLPRLPFTEPLPDGPGAHGAGRGAGGEEGREQDGSDGTRAGRGDSGKRAAPDRAGDPGEAGETALPEHPDRRGPASGPVAPIDDPLHDRLDDRVGLLAAFGLFNLKLPRGRPDRLDLTDTARNYARALLDSARWGTGDRCSAGVPILPSLRPGARRAVRLTLVVDTGVSMLFQRGVADDLTRLLRHSGIFRSVDLLGFDPHRYGPPQLVAPDGHPRNLRPPGEGGGPHVTLILTDGLGAAWSDAGFQGWIARAARGGAVAVLNLLHPQLWRRGGIRTEPARIRASWPASPGGPNTGYLRERTFSAGGERPRGTLVPVLPLSAEALHDWASFTMMRSRSRLRVHVAEYPDPGALTAPDGTEGELAPEGGAGLERDAPPAGEAVLRFRRTASPEAFELAVALAAVPLHPAVVSEVCRDVLGRTSPSELTEVFFSGLVRLAEGVLEEDPAEEVRWAFRPGVRARLLALGGEVPEIRRMLRLTVRVLGGRDPWFDDLARMLDGEHVTAPQAGAGARVWVEPMLPAVRSAAVARRYRTPVDIYARGSEDRDGGGFGGDAPEGGREEHRRRGGPRGTPGEEAGQ